MTADNEHSESSAKSARIDRFLNSPKVRLFVGIFEIAAVAAAVTALVLTYQSVKMANKSLELASESLELMADERHDRKESRSFRAWGIVLDTSEMALEGDEIPPKKESDTSEMALEGDEIPPKKESLFFREPFYRDIVSRVTAGALEFLNGYDQSLQGVVLPDTNLSGIDLRDATLSRSNFSRTVFSDATFTGAKLTDAKLYYAKLEDAKFRGANLSNARLRYADFKGAKLVDADLTGADLECAINLSQPQLDQACADPSKEAPLLKTKGCDDGKKVERQALEWKPRRCPDSGSAAK